MVRLFLLYPSYESILIWELFREEENELVWKWKEFLRMPPLSLHEYLDDDWWHAHEACVCVGDYLCFSSLLGDEGARVFAYNLKGFGNAFHSVKFRKITGVCCHLNQNPIFIRFSGNPENELG
ncbi:hypothetical protein SUGI_0671500 [Cryptomeria japonica]|nr:hypothetical protein SUGI_0671500 [Cryptomeria japonica]